MPSGVADHKAQKGGNRRLAMVTETGFVQVSCVPSTSVLG
jgi:hypothetical protein